jgi:hypothetical protein|tara:strand:- start:400 stop:600 length:201 start_codon:yes stop_codon:yes gene_type:complete
MKLKFDIPTIEFDFTEEQLKKFVEYYATKVPELTVLDGDKFTDEFMDIIITTSQLKILQDIELICN